MTADAKMNQTTLLQIIERLEGLLARLPEKIRRPVLSELTPLKELFLQQRPPRFLFVGSGRMPMQQIINRLIAPGAEDQMNVTLMPVHCWAEWHIPSHGTISVLDARDAIDPAETQIEEDLKRQPADIIFLFDDSELDLGKLPTSSEAKIVGVSVGSEKRVAQFSEALNAQPAIRDRLLSVVRLAEENPTETRHLMSVLAEQLPNEAKIEVIRISRDRDAQHHVARMLVKSTTAICSAIGAQPIPLADLPILTSLQLMMVSGIMYVSGRERSLRAAAEFLGVLGANVGAALLLREGARAILKFFPGWGNVVCGLVAGSGTYAIGRAATLFFIDGVPLKEVRRTYLHSRRKRRLLHEATPPAG
jgi:uncharacterized protein (DUF697 family)